MRALRSSVGLVFFFGIFVGASAFAGCGSSSSNPGTSTDGGGGGGDDASGSGDDGGPAGSDGGSGFDANGPHTTIRIMTGNLTSGGSQTYTNGEGERIFEGLHADIMMVQEFQYASNSDADIQTFVTAICGNGCSYYRQPGVTIPNGIVTKFPIKSSGFWDDTKVDASQRDFAWAQIDIPGPIDLWAVSVHLLTSSATNRNDQANELVSYIQANVPAGDYVVIGGDFNTDDRGEAAVGTLSAVVSTDDPWPADGSGDQNTNAPRSHPYDYVVASPSLFAQMIDVTIGSQSFHGGLVVDTRVYTPITDIAPAMTTDSAATNMQHMGVVRDFSVPQ